MDISNQPRFVLYRVAEDDPANRNPQNYRPALIVRQWSPKSANLLVFLDGSDDEAVFRATPSLGLTMSKADAAAGNCGYVAWGTSRMKGDEVGQWIDSLVGDLSGEDT